MPAKVVKRGVTWNRNRKDKFSQDELNVWRAKASVVDDLMLKEEE
jgi:hypothetical protein